MEILGVEIFAAGKWKPSNAKPVEITEQDLDEMVKSFDALGQESGFSPALKLGHTETEKYFGDGKGAPRLGSVSRIWREGKKILADFANVPEALVDLMRNRRYNQVSVEVFPTYEYEGKTYRNLLSAVALLGAELPAVKGLKDLASSLFEAFDDEQLRVEYTQEIEMKTFTEEQHEAILATAVKNAGTEAEQKFSAEINELKETNAAQATEIGELREQKEALEAKAAEYAEDKRTAQINAVIEKGVSEGRILPRQKESMLAMANSMQGTVKFGDSEKEGVDAFEAFVNTLPKVAKFEEKGSGEGEEKEFSLASDELHERTKALMEKDGIQDYAAASAQVLAADADLKSRYARGI